MKFNPEINLGTVIEIAMLLIVVIGAVRKVGAWETKIDTMWEWWQSHADYPAQAEPRRIRTNGAWPQK